MFKKLLKIFFLFALTTILITGPVSAADFALTSIGNYDTSEGVPSQIWYTSSQPTFSGTGTSGASVSIIVDTTTYTTTVAATEQWSWIPPQPLASGDHQVVITSGSNSLSFVLTIGTSTATPTPTTAVTATTTPTPTTSTTTPTPATRTLPTSGNFMPTLLVFGVALGLICLPVVRRWVFAEH